MKPESVKGYRYEVVGLLFLVRVNGIDVINYIAWAKEERIGREKGGYKLLSSLIGTPLDDGHPKKTNGVLHSVVCPLTDDLKGVGVRVRLLFGHKLSALAVPTRRREG
jgi:hypothetical protein